MDRWTESSNRQRTREIRTQTQTQTRFFFVEKVLSAVEAYFNCQAAQSQQMRTLYDSPSVNPLLVLACVPLSIYGHVDYL